jgi:hypothetical protein
MDSRTHAVVAIPVRVVTGQSISKCKLDTAGRGRLASDILAHRVELHDLTKSQLAQLLKIGTRSIPAQPHHSPKRNPAETMTQIWAAAVEAERLAFVHGVGVEEIWDAIVAVMEKW